MEKNLLDAKRQKNDRGVANKTANSNDDEVTGNWLGDPYDVPVKILSRKHLKFW
jgi:hypothetical protein